MGRGCLGGKVEAVLTCQGDIDDPAFPSKCQQIFNKLQSLLDNKELDVTKCEPWNSVKVTFNIPKDAAEKLARLAEAGDQVLKELGILSIQVEGGQVISMTMVEDHSDDEVESISTPTKSSPHKDTPSKREDGPSNALLSPADGIPASYKGTSIRNFSSPGSRLNHGSRDLLNSPSSSFSLKSSSELTLGGSQTTKDGLLASLVASRTAGKSDLFNVKDSDEPVAKKARKVDGINKSSDNSLGYTFSKYVGSGSGFTILPVNSSTLTAGSGSSSSSSAGGSSRSSSSTTASGSHSSSASITADPLSGSSVKLANLPGVSLTSVSRANMASSSGSRSTSGGGGLMPPPSSVTLSPVPRQTNPSLVNSPNERLSESDSSLGGSGKSTGSPSSSSSSNKLSASDSSTKLSLLSSKDTNNKQTFLINPITGQFEMGPPEPDPDAAAAAAASGDPQATKSTATVSVVGSEPSKIKVEVGQTSPGGEHSLKLKLKVSGPKVKESSSSSSSSSNTSSSGSSQQPQSGGKLPKLKIKLKEKSVELEQSSPPPSLHNNEDSLESTKTSALPPHPPSASSLDDVNSSSSSSSSSTKSPQDESTSSAASANVSSPPPQQQLEAVTAASAAGHVQIDLKTRVRIKPLPEKMRILENSKSPDGHHFGKLNNSQINHISVDTTPDKQRSKKSNMKEKKGDKNRLKIWTDSLAKHTKREDSGSKETKRWPEVLENRLFVQGSGQHSNQSNKLENNKNLEQDEKTRSDQDDESSNDNHLNWAGPGRGEGVALPGPGPTHPLSPPQAAAASLAAKSPHLQHQPQPDDSPHSSSSSLADSNKTSSSGGLSSVLDILEGRRALGEPVSPLTGHHHTDQSGHQGEDSGIESGDTLSEKSPNQGESPFHASAASAESMERMPTYSSSVVGSVVSGKLSPPVSDSGSTDSLVTATPPDKSPHTTAGGNGGKLIPEQNCASSNSGQSPPSSTDQSSSLNCDSHPSNNISPTLTDSCSLVTQTNSCSPSDTCSDDSKIVSSVDSLNSNSVIISRSSALTTVSTPSLDTTSNQQHTASSNQEPLNEENLPSSKSPLPLAENEVVTKLVNHSDSSNTDNIPLTSSSTTESASNVVAQTSSTGEAATSSTSFPLQTTSSTTSSSSTSLVCIPANPAQVQSDPLLGASGDEPVEEPDSDLIRSCDGADDKVSPDLLDMETKHGSAGCVDGVIKDDPKATAAATETVEIKPQQIIQQLPLTTITPTAVVASTMGKTITSTILLTSGSVSNKVVTIATPAFISSHPTLLTTSNPSSTISTSITVTTLSAATAAGGGTTHHQLSTIRPGAKMVPVKLVSVPGHGGAMRMVRVSPVKGAEIAASSASLPPRTVVIKSSLLRPLSSSANINISDTNSSGNNSSNSTTTITTTNSINSSNPAATNSTVQFPAPSSSICDSIVPPDSRLAPPVTGPEAPSTGPEATTLDSAPVSAPPAQESSSLKPTVLIVEPGDAAKPEQVNTSLQDNVATSEFNCVSPHLPPPATNTSTSQSAPVKGQQQPPPEAPSQPQISLGNNQDKPQESVDVNHQNDTKSKSPPSPQEPERRLDPPLESRLDEVEEVVKPLPHQGPAEVVALDSTDSVAAASGHYHPVQAQRTVPVLTNGDTANEEITDLKTLSSARRSRNNGGGSNIKSATVLGSSNGSDLNGDSADSNGSLLKPLISSSTTTVATAVADGVLVDAVVATLVPEVDTPPRGSSPQELELVTPPSGVQPPAASAAAHGKRSRRDTGSSVQSDRSDLSSVTGVAVAGNQEPAAKRLKEEKGVGRRGSTSPGAREPSTRIQDRRKPEDPSNPDAKTVGVNKKKPVTKSEPVKKGVAGGVTNGTKHNSNTALKPKSSAAAADNKTKTAATTAAAKTKKTVAAAKTALSTKSGGGGAAAAVNQPAKAGGKTATGGGGGANAVVGNNALASVKTAAVSGVKAAAADKVSAQDPGRRVSARVKKPDEKPTTETKRKR